LKLISLWVGSLTQVVVAIFVLLISDLELSELPELFSKAIYVFKHEFGAKGFGLAGDILYGIDSQE
jgi:hypothetical protein